MSAVIAPLEAFGKVSRQNGTSSTIEATVGLLRPMTLKWLFGRSCAAAPNATDTPSAIPASERCDMVPSSLPGRWLPRTCPRPARGRRDDGRTDRAGGARARRPCPAMLQNGRRRKRDREKRKRKHVDHDHGGLEH